MDSPKITHISLCSGYGGIDLGLKGVFGENVRTVAYAEIEAFAVECLLARMGGGQLDPAPIWPNLKTFPWGAFSDRVDILSGGYPCQPFSAAGKRLGTDDPRHLWPYIADGIRLLRPKCCFFENVEGHISLGLRAVIEELGSLGYKTTWGIFSAREVGAPHQRKRVFILAHRNNQGLQRAISKSIQRQSREFVGHNNDDLADSNNSGSGEDQLPSELRTIGVEQSSRCSRLSSESTQVGKITVWPSRPGESQNEWEPPRVVGYSKGSTSIKLPIRTEEKISEFGCNGKRFVGNSSDKRSQRQSCGEFRQPKQEQESKRSNGENTNQRQAQPSLGRDADGTAGGLDYAKLCVSCDNRTDELRLLGNGVVPATATRAFLTLMKQLNE